MKKILFLFYILHCMSIIAQNGSIKGKIISYQNGIEGVSLTIVGTPFYTKTNMEGNYELKSIPAGEYKIQISFIGYRTINENIVIEEGKYVEKNFELYEDLLSIEEVVITGTRSEVPQYRSPVIVSRISSRSFESTQSLSLSEGLNFTPGLRLETNCQNCGFTQVRMNGLDGPYSQILINSRPIFSALVGVYGLDMIPASMIDRVEVTRGGGSALYGGNAIAGTINIITKDPSVNTFEIGTNYAFTDFKVPDKTYKANGSIISDNFDKGISFYAYNRDRKAWDANEDGFSEATSIKNTTFGLDTFCNTSLLSKIKLNFFTINEFRRGGNKFDLPPHQTDITEQLTHHILGGGLSYEQVSEDYKHKYALYTSAQTANRDSYYGSGGRVLEIGDELTPEDILALNSYGKSKDITWVGGAQYSYELNDKWMLMSGSEFQTNQVQDQMRGYNRLIDQKVSSLGVYAQLEYKPTTKMTFLAGSRFENIHIHGKYNLAVDNYQDKKSLSVFVPRLTAMYALSEKLKARASFSQGFRAPQAFDEDLHIQTTAGAVMFTKLDSNLTTERSTSINASLNYTKTYGEVQTNIVLEGFYTRLHNSFITSDPQEMENGATFMTKRNGNGAYISGVNLETSFAFSRKLKLQLGATYQTARYNKPEIIWKNTEDESEITTTRNILKSPNFYGYYILSYNFSEPFRMDLSGVYTSSMDIAHIVDASTQETVIKTTPSFFEQHIKFSYDIDFDKNCIQLYTGVHNIFDSFQKDFDTGKTRDANYIYGPSRPKTFFAGVNYKFN